MNRKRIPIVMAAALFGILVWLSVNLRDEYQVTVTAPLTIQDIPDGWALGSPLPKAVQIRLRGPGWRLSLLLLGPEVKLSIPYGLLATANPASSLRDAADRAATRPGIQLVDIKPDSFSMGLERMSHKHVPVILDHTISLREGYGQVGPVLITPDSVTVNGASTVLRRIESWPTSTGTFEDLKASVDADLLLAEPPGRNLTLSAASVHVRINVQPFAEKVLSGLPVDISGVPPNREVILIPPKIEVVARGGIKQLSGLSPEDFRVIVGYPTIAADTTGLIDAIVTPPSGIQIVSKRPDRLQYIVRKRL